MFVHRGADLVQDSRVSRSGRLATDQKAVRRRGPGRVVLGSKPQLATAKLLVRWAEHVNAKKFVNWPAGATSYFPRYLLRQRGPRAGFPRRLLRGRLGRPRLLLLPL